MVKAIFQHIWDAVHPGHRMWKEKLDSVARRVRACKVDEIGRHRHDRLGPEDDAQHMRRHHNMARVVATRTQLARIRRRAFSHCALCC